MLAHKNALLGVWISLSACGAQGKGTAASSGKASAVQSQSVPSPSPVTPPNRQEPTRPKELADKQQLEALLDKFYEGMFRGFRVADHQVVARGAHGGKPAELVRFKATADFSGKLRRMCGQMALSYDREFRTYTFVAGANVIDWGRSCDAEPLIECFGCGKARPFSKEIVKRGYKFSAVSTQGGLSSTTK